MSTRPGSTDTSPDSERLNPFAGLSAGLGFFQDWMKAAGSALPNLPGTSGGGTTGIPSWSMPTLDPEELDKRIQELRTVQFWLEQNARMIGVTIQGLEVQRMTLSTLKGMNVSMDAVRDAFKARTQAAAPPEPPAPPPPAPQPSWMHRSSAAAPREEPAPEASSAPADADASAEPAPQPDLINPMRWWDTLTQQFTHLAQQATPPVSQPAANTTTRRKAASPDTDKRPSSQRTTSATAKPSTSRGSTTTARRRSNKSAQSD